MLKKLLFSLTIVFTLTTVLVGCSFATTYKITFDTDGGSEVKAIIAVPEAKIHAPAEPTKEGYEFLGWYLDGKLYEFTTMPSVDTTLVAKWQKIDLYTITFEGAEVDPIVSAEGLEIILPIPTKEGYNFLGWYLNDVKYEETLMGNKNITLTAKWEKILKLFSVTFNSEGGSEVESQEVLEGECVIAPNNPTKEDYEFMGWLLNGEAYDFSQPVVGDIELVASWKEVIKLCNVTFNSDGGSEVESQEVVVGELVNIPNDPTKEGYKFFGWLLNGEAYDFSQPVLTDLELVALWFKDEVAPIITVDFDHLNVNLFESFNPLSGVSAWDAVDGDLTSSIEVIGSVDVNNYGTYELEYKVVDSFGNEATAKRIVEVVWGYATDFIGHMGCYYGVANTEEAFIYAANVLKYQALETDLKSTKDGVFVLCHDDTWGGYTIANTTWDVLKDVEVTSTRTSGYAKDEMPGNGTYTSKICSLERYLEICKEYNVKAVIELKSSPGITNSDQSNMANLMKVIESKDMLNNVIFLGSSYNCLIWVKQNGYSYIPCQYLVNSCESQTYLERCITYGLDISINVTGGHSNSDEWIAKYKAAGCEVSTYTFTQYVDYSEVQKWIDKGVDYVTVDWQSISKLNNYETEKHEVTFLDKDGNNLGSVIVKDGRTPRIPSVPSVLGYEFIGWSEDVTSVKADMEVTTMYQKAEYKINYELYNGVSSVTLVDKYYYDSETIILPTQNEMSIEKGTFINWVDGDGNVVTEIATGSTGDIILYAVWAMDEASVMILSNADEAAINKLYLDNNNQVATIIVNPSVKPGSSYVLTDNIINASSSYLDYKYIYGTNLFADITSALAASVDGDIIYILAGDYQEELTISIANITVAGPNYGIKGNATRQAEAHITGLTNINASGVTINGFKFSGNGAIKVGANDVTITNIHMSATQVNANGVNRKGCIVDSANISGLTVSNSYINAPGTQNSYTTQFMAFNNVTDLSIIDNYITNTAQTTLNSSYAGMRIYHMSGKFICTGNEFRWQTTGYLMILGGSSNTCTEVTISDNIIAGYGNNTTAGIRLYKAVSGANAVVNIEGNEWYNCSGSTLIINADEVSTFNVKYNYYDENTSFKLGNSGATGSNTTFDHNCYMTTQSTSTNDVTTYSSLEELRAAYLEYKQN